MGVTSFSGPVLVGTTVDKTSSYTVVVNTDSGKQFVSKTNGVVFTLPAIATGEVYTFINTAADGINDLTISPNSSDGIMYLGSKVDNKDLINTQATSKQGDFVVLVSLEETGAWQVSSIKGIWAKES